MLLNWAKNTICIHFAVPIKPPGMFWLNSVVAVVLLVSELNPLTVVIALDEDCDNVAVCADTLPTALSVTVNREIMINNLNIVFILICGK